MGWHRRATTPAAVGASFASQAARLGVIAKALPTSLWLAAGAIKCAAAPDAAVIQPRCSRL
jgi:hypothetical protein